MSEQQPMTAMTAEQIDAIRQAVDAATPGPWRLSPVHWHKGCAGRNCKQSIFSPGRRTIAVAFGAQYRASHNEEPRTELDSDDAHLIVNAPKWINSLLAEVQRLREWEDAALIPGENCEDNGGYQGRATPDDLREMIEWRMSDERNQLTAEVQRQQGEIARLQTELEQKQADLFEDIGKHFAPDYDKLKRLQAENDQQRRKIEQITEEYNEERACHEQTRQGYKAELERLEADVTTLKLENKDWEKEYQQALKRESFLTKAHREADNQLRELLKGDRTNE
ncbi:hypothetical protein M3223_04175 [Paenibacillus pasadenensis]|uniref:hypothetical protein n=1 Tax=Paenibacillus pasadenensis TaxID=217090 RepID=UPI00203DE561|nr:hypothetical protein [Paenibacillus pasadenensis]MCM3746546.1 hypothetical protein [Paenibacillus pasadenensis]